MRGLLQISICYFLHSMHDAKLTYPILVRIEGLVCIHNAACHATFHQAVGNLRARRAPCREHQAELRRAEAAARNLRREAEEQRRAAAQSQAAVQRLENDTLRLSTELATAEQESRRALTSSHSCNWVLSF